MHLLLAAEHVAHGPPGQHRAENGERLGEGVDLAAKPAAHRAADEVEGVGRHVEDLGAGVEREEQGLRRRVNDVAPVGVGRGDRAVSLGRRMLDRRHLVALFEHMIRLGETAFDIAEAQLLMIVDVVVGEAILRVGLVDHGGAGFQGLLDVKYGQIMSCERSFDRRQREVREMFLVDSVELRLFYQVQYMRKFDAYDSVRL